VTPPRRRKLLIVNPNTSKKVTGWLAAEARRVLSASWDIVAVNAASGLAAIETPADLTIAAQAVVSAIAGQTEAAGAIIAAFGDPGLSQARARHSTPVSGLGESGLLAAAAGGRRFAIVTLGSAMQEAIADKVAALGLARQLAAIRLLPLAIADLIEDRDCRLEEVADTVRACVKNDGADAVLLGGAPFAGMAFALSRALGANVLDGVAASIDWHGASEFPH